MATIKRTGGADFPDKLKALVSGSPKSGKTTLLGTIPNIIIADTEPKANNLASLAHLDIPYVTIEGTPDLRELLMVLGNDSLRAQAAASAGMPSIDAVAIDTLDTLQKIMKRERMADQRTTKFLRDDWGWLKEEMTKIIEAFTALPLHVVFCVHLKTQDIGTEDNPATKILPGLEGAIASEIAGMVGYSFLSFRKEELDVASGQKYTKYWLRAEGDETYDFLGNRTAGRLPAVIEPNFGAVYAAAMAGRAQMSAPAAPTQLTQAPTAPPVQEVPAQPAQPAAEPSAPESGPNPGPASTAPEAAPQAQAPAPQEAPQAAAQPAARPDGKELVGDNQGALQHMKRVYDALQVGFPEEKLKTITLDDARTLVKMWAGIQADDAEGKLPAGTTTISEMTDYLTAMDLLPSAQQAAPEPEKQVEPKLGGTIAEAKAYTADGADLSKVQEAYDYEVANGNRSSLISWLEGKGAKPATPATSETAPGTPEVQTSVQTEAPVAPVEQAAPPVTPAAPVADTPPTEAEATKAVEEGLGGVTIDETINADAHCEQCQKPIDDRDIAKLSKTRFGKVLCVDDYIAATRA